MSYQALYRKYRPKTLKDVIGQDVVIQILKNAIQNNKICHAYMFSGPRGIGKTSIAKLVAKTVNCLHTENGDSCGKCENCNTINNGFNPDIIEIDAASNNGVDEIREIKNKINLVPNQLKYKVYIIDEVHMLSIGAFNALLKTLEEPPEHIIFILATTDLHKVPTTIISRCQCFEFHRISRSDIVTRLEFICSEENILIDKTVLERIADLSDGGLRDAIGMLDKLNAYSNSNITLEDFERVNGIVSEQDRVRFLDSVFHNDIKYVIQCIDQIYDSGKDLIIFSQDMLELCKNKSIAYYIENDNSYDIQFLISFSNILNDMLKNIKFLSDVKTVFEINILSFMYNYHIENIGTKSDIVKKNNDNNYQLETKKEVDIKKEDKIISREIILDEKKIQSIYDSNINLQIINNCFARADKKEKQYFESNWNLLNDYALDNEYGAAACFLSDGKIRAVGVGEIIVSFDYESMVNRGLSLIIKIQKLLEKIYNKHYDIALITDEEWNYQKEKFIENKNNNISYEYIPIESSELNRNALDKSIEKDESITSQAIELFGEDIISIN